MGKTLALISVAALTLALCCEAVSTKAVSHSRRYRHERSHRRFHYLQDIIDRLDLRQKIDHILITNLQKALKEVQDRGDWLSKALLDLEVAKDGKMKNEITSQEPLKGEEERSSWLSRTVADFVKKKPAKEKEVNMQELKPSKTLADVERKKDPPERSPVVVEEEDDSVKRQVKERQKENIEVSDQEQRDEILLLRQELAALRSEVRVLKEERAAEIQHISAHSIQQEHREAVTASWVVENVKRLQDAVVELQEAMNVTTALHDKQEVESRLLVVSRDLGALRSSLSSVTSKAEAAMATVQTVREELVRTAEDSNHARGKAETLGLEVSGIREEFNHLLSSLPDGLTVRGLQDTKKDSTPSSNEMPRLTSLPPASKQHRQLEERVKATESGIQEIRASSIQLLDAVESLEAQVETGVAEVRQEVAKLEYKMTSLQESAKLSDVPSNRSDVQALTNRINQLETKKSATQDSGMYSLMLNNRSGVQSLRNRMDQLEYKLRVVQDSAKIPHSDSDFKALSSRVDQLVLFLASVDNRSISECRSSQLALDHKLNEAMTRLGVLEREIKKS